MNLWEPKMCRLAWQLLGMLDNVLGLLGMLCNVLGMLAPRVWWYTTPLVSQLIRKQVGGFIFDVELLEPCGKHAEEAEDVAKHAYDVAKHA